MSPFPASYIIQQILILQGFVSAPELKKDWPCYVAFMPEVSEYAGNIICCYDPEGLPDGRILRTGETIEHPSAQLQIRASRYLDGYSKGKDICDFLETIHNYNMTLSDIDFKVQNISRTSPIFSLGSSKEDRDKQLFTINFNLTVN